jgi:phosphoribosylformimino-5-aminoimidazole carboxamide ribotide isomerase
MILLPAIDLIDGRAVRLAQGDFSRQTDYYADPLEAAKRWVDDGARALHLVDLDGARTGTPANTRQLERITAELAVPVQVGGGLRSLESVRAAVAAGASHVILGTAAFRDPALLEGVLAEYPEQLVVSVDARAGRVAESGWLTQTDLEVSRAVEDLERCGVSRFVYSSIDRDGMLSGPDLDGCRALAARLSGSFVYSGGIGSLADLRALAELGEPKLTGVIVGKAIYESRFSVAEAQALLDGVAA